MGISSACVLVPHMLAQCGRRPEEGVGSLGLELRTVMSHRVSVGKSNQCSQPWSHVSGPVSFNLVKLPSAMVLLGLSVFPRGLWDWILASTLQCRVFVESITLWICFKYYVLKLNILGQHGGSVGESASTCVQAWQPEVSSWNLHGRRGEPNCSQLSSDNIQYSCILEHACTHTHPHSRTQNNV